MPPLHGPSGRSTKLWTEPPVFPSGAGGLVTTLADWHRFGRMLLSDGGGLLSPESVRLMTTDHLTPEQRDASTLFLEGAGWGFGGSVAADGRYGWVGGTGTTAHVPRPRHRRPAPHAGTDDGPEPTPLMRASGSTRSAFPDPSGVFVDLFGWRFAAGHGAVAIDGLDCVQLSGSGKMRWFRRWWP